MITVTAHPIADPKHIVIETFASSEFARKWCQLLKRNSWEFEVS